MREMVRANTSIHYFNCVAGASETTTSPRSIGSELPKI